MPTTIPLVAERRRLSSAVVPAPRAPVPVGRTAGLSGFRIDLLGEFSVVHESCAGSSADVWRRTHPRRLLQLVGAQRRGSISRTEALRALWPRLDDAHARNRLHHTLHLIRKFSESLESGRPLLVLEGEVISLAEGVSVDVADFLSLIDRDGDDAQRLEHLLAAIAIYKGDLASDWTDDHGIESRRQAIRRSYLQALADAAELSRDAGNRDQAILLMQRRTHVDPGNVTAHVDYASILLEAGRSDLAAAHCQAARKQVAESVDIAAARPLDDLLASIQRQSNKPVAGQPADVPSMGARMMIGRRGQVSAPKMRLHGRSDLINEICLDLEDPYHSVVTLCGPPGSGRSTLALHVAAAVQSKLRDGAVHVSCSDAPDADAVLARLAAAVCPAEAGVGVDIDALSRALAPREMLVLLDDVSVTPPVCRLISSISQAARDCRFLVCAPRRLRLAAERVVKVEFLADADEATPAGDPALRPAIDLLVDQVRTHSPARRLDERYLAGLDRIAALVEGWPLALVVVGRRLAWMQPPEVIVWLEKWHAATDVSDEPMEKAMILWADGAVEALPILVKAACFEGWFTRSDLALLLDQPPRSTLDSFFDAAFETHLIKRRSVREASGEVSEYRIPFLVRNWLRARSLRADLSVSRRRHALWLRWKVSPSSADPSATRAAQLALLATRRKGDIESVTRFLAETDEHHLLQSIVDALIPGLRLARETGPATTWISRAIDSHQASVPALANLYLERAGLLSRAGSTAQAYEDAQAAYRIASDLNVEEVRLRAAQMLQSLGRETGAHPALPGGEARMHPLVAHGVEAGENLLRIARVSARFGEFDKASDLSAKAAEVFRYFNCPLGEIRALRYRGRMAFAVGNLEDVQSFAQLAVRLASDRNLPAEQARAQLILAEVALAQEDFIAAMRSAGRILSSAQGRDPLVQVRAYKVLAWGHYLDRQTEVAAMLQRELAQRADVIGDPSHIANSHLLRALLACEMHGPESVQQSVTRLHGVLVASPGAFDAQSELSEVAYLSAFLGRPATATGLLNSLATFARQPGHQLRPLTRTRVTGVEALLSTRTDCVIANQSRLGTRDALADLVGNG
jgi:DNA-binding SARP family transcriptional activator/RecA/RadA recombinase